MSIRQLLPNWQKPIWKIVFAESTKTDLQNCFCRIDTDASKFSFSSKIVVWTQGCKMEQWSDDTVPSTIHEHVSRLQKLEKENIEVLCHPLPSLTSPAIPYSSFELHLTMEPSPAKKPKQDLCQLSTDDWDVLRKLMGYYFCKVSTTFPPQKWNPRRRKSNRTWDIWHRKTLKPSVKWTMVGKSI